VEEEAEEAAEAQLMTNAGLTKTKPEAVVEAVAKVTVLEAPAMVHVADLAVTDNLLMEAEAV
jgi:hypothetical protein